MDAIGFGVVVAVAGLACGAWRAGVQQRRRRLSSELKWLLHASALLAANGHLAVAAQYAGAALAHARRSGDRACEALALDRLRDITRAGGEVRFALGVDDR